MLSVQEAASTIRNLINASPTSPRQDELEAIIARVTTSEASEHTATKRAAYLGLLSNLKEVCDRADLPDDDPDLARANDAVTDFEDAAWAAPAGSWSDVLLRAEIARFNENGVMDALHNDNAYRCERSAAQLIDAVLTLGRRAFGHEDDGRRHGDV